MAIVTNDYVSAINTIYTKVRATRLLIESAAVKRIAEMAPMIGNDPIFNDALRHVRFNLILRSASLNPVTAFIETGLYELDLVEKILLDKGADKTEPNPLLIAASLREADDALRPGPESIRIGHMESRAIASWVRTFEAGLVQENLRRIISAYRFITGDYDQDIHHERLFIELAGKMIGTVNSYYGDLIDIDRDSIFKALADPGSLLVVGSRPSGSGTVSLVFDPGKRQPVSVISRLFIDSPDLYLLREGAWERVTYIEVEKLALSHSEIAA